MKSTLRLTLAILGVGFIWFVVTGSLMAQGIVDAITLSDYGLVGYVNSGIGWSFVPTSDLLVNAIFSSAPQVTFLQGPNQIIATYTYASYNYLPQNPPFNFQPIQPLRLSAGQTYYVSTEFSSYTSTVNFLAYSLNGIDNNGVGEFTTSSYISQFASYTISQPGQWTPSIAPPNSNTGLFLLGPDFQFQVVPEPGGPELLVLAAGVLLISKRCGRRLQPNRLTSQYKTG